MIELTGAGQPNMARSAYYSPAELVSTDAKLVWNAPGRYAPARTEGDQPRRRGYYPGADRSPYPLPRRSSSAKPPGRRQAARLPATGGEPAGLAVVRWRAAWATGGLVAELASFL